jgi:hypothetical protein
MTRADMDKVRDQFVAAAEMAERAGFDMIELHAAHGYLLSSFITPLSPTAHRRIWRHARKPHALSAGGVPCGARRVAGGQADLGAHLGHDWVGDEGVDAGRGGRDREAAARRPASTSCDVSAGQTSIRCQAGLWPHVPDAVLRPHPQRGRHADHGGRQHLRADHVNSILMAGRADLVCLARPHLADPYWTLHAGGEAERSPGEMAETYWPGRDQAYRLAERAGADDGESDDVATRAGHRRRHGRRRAIALALAAAGASRSRSAAGGASRSKRWPRSESPIYIAAVTGRRDRRGVDGRTHAASEAARGPFDIVIANAGIAVSAPAAQDDAGRLEPDARGQPDRRVPDRAPARGGMIASAARAGSSFIASTPGSRAMPMSRPMSRPSMASSA